MADNEASGDPFAGRFPMDRALEGLPAEGDLRARLVTEAGEIHCRLLADSAPLTVANFVGLARGLRPFQPEPNGEWVTEPYYDGLPFHRAVEAQFVQTGKRGGQKWPGFRLQDEVGVGSAFDRPGIMAMATDGGPNTGAAQFFITMEPLRSLDEGYTMFGRCEDDWVVREIGTRVLSGDTVLLEHVEISRG